MGKSLISYHSKKHTCVSLSTTESEYLAVGSYGTQLLWMVNQLPYYDLSFEGVPIFCDNTSAISLSKYIAHHSRDKHIDIKHHFIRNHVENNDFCLNLLILIIS